MCHTPCEPSQGVWHFKPPTTPSKSVIVTDSGACCRWCRGEVSASGREERSCSESVSEHTDRSSDGFCGDNGYWSAMKIAIRLEKKKIPSMIRIASQIRLALAKLTLLRLLLPPSAHMISTIRLTNGIVTTKRIRNHSPTEMIWSCGDWTGMDEALENEASD